MLFRRQCYENKKSKGTFQLKAQQNMYLLMDFVRCLLRGRKVMTNLDSVLKNKNITLLTEVHIVKALVFPVVMYICESWTIKRLNTEKLMLLNCGAGEDS